MMPGRAGGRERGLPKSTSLWCTIIHMFCLAHDISRSQISARETSGLGYNRTCRCWYAHTPDFHSCSDYAAAGYTCVGNFCAAMDPAGDPSVCAHIAEAGTVVDNRTGRCVNSSEDPCSTEQRRHPVYPADKAALLRAFVFMRADKLPWHNVGGWTQDTDPCVDAWPGVRCDATGRVQSIEFTSSMKKLRCRLSPAVGQLSALHSLKLGHVQLYGTLPPTVGNLAQLRVLSVFGPSDLSGTLPAQLGQLAQLQTLAVETCHNLSGTLPPEIGALTHLQHWSMFENVRLSGTLPPQLGELPQIQTIDLSTNRMLSGTLPHLTVGTNLTQLTDLDLFGLPMLSGTLVQWLGTLPQLRELWLWNNPQLSGTIPSQLGSLAHLELLQMFNNVRLSGTLPPEFAGLTHLKILDISTNNLISGTVPDLVQCAALQSLNLGNTSLSALPNSLPPALTHLYLNNNPMRATVASLGRLLAGAPSVRVLDVGLTNLSVVLEYNGRAHGPKVANPGRCHIGDPCRFVLHMYDAEDRAVHTGGLLKNLTLRWNGSSTPMRDNRDGSFTATVPPLWIPRKGHYLFQFFHDEREFRPMLTAASTFALGGDCPHSGGGACASLRTVEFAPRRCAAGAHTAPDDTTGGRCLCQPGFVPDHGGGTGRLTCHRRCRTTERLGSNGVSCLCAAGYYDSDVYGTLVCSSKHWETADTLATVAARAQSARRASGSCLPCPSQCVSCVAGESSSDVVVHEGWRLNSTNEEQLTQQLLDGRDGRLQVIFSCPYAPQDCPELSLGANYSAFSQLSCPAHHAGALCASCVRGYSREGSIGNTCSACRSVSDYTKDTFGVSSAVFVTIVACSIATIFGLVYLVYVRLGLWQAVKPNFRIVVGSVQVLALLPAALALVFPPQTGMALSFISFFAADLRQLVRAECWGWSWFDKWVLSVAGIPAVAMLVLGGRWLWRWLVAARSAGAERAPRLAAAREEAVRGLWLVIMLMYPQLSASIFSALRCRTLGAGASWLEADYSVSCLSRRYHRYRLMAYILIAAVPLGIPLGLLLLLMHTHRRSQSRSAGRQAEEDQLNVALRSLLSTSSEADDLPERGRHTFSFVTEDYRKEFFWFEPVDMLRKLALSGLLQLIHRGTAAQCFLGCIVAFVSFGLQQRLQPYREVESNTLKALVDCQLFLTFLVSFILRVLPVIDPQYGNEPFGQAFYGWLLLTSIVMLLVAVVVLTTRQIVRGMRQTARVLPDESQGLDGSQ